MITTIRHSLQDKKKLLKSYIRQNDWYNIVNYPAIPKLFLDLFRKFDIPKREISYTDVSDDTIFCHFFHYCVNNIFKRSHYYYVLGAFKLYMLYDDVESFLRIIYFEYKCPTCNFLKERIKKNRTIIRNGDTFYKVLMFQTEYIMCHKLIPNNTEKYIVLSMSRYEPELLKIKWTSNFIMFTIKEDLYLEKKI